MVGICGVVPIHPETGDEIRLGDCIISTSIIQYDLGRQYPSGFQRRDTANTMGKANPAIGSLTPMLKTRRNRNLLTQKLNHHLEDLQRIDSVRYPGVERDHLFDSNYLHQHRPSTDSYDKCLPGLGTCTKICEAIGCEMDQLMTRQRSSTIAYQPHIHFGSIGSANMVMKSGEDRDMLSKAVNVVAFEMEGSGVWDAFPTVIIKSACDCADSHKNKEWQHYAAATAATGLKAVLGKLDLPDEDQGDYLQGLISEYQGLSLY